MFTSSRVTWILAGIAICGAANLSAADKAGPIRSRAVLDLTFDAPPEATGAAAPALALVNDPARVPSPFWGQTGRHALRLASDKRQFIQIPNRPEPPRTGAVSLGFFILSLVEPSDATAHGLVALQSDSGGSSSIPLSITFNPAADALWVSVDDGAQRHAAEYDFDEHFGQRKRAFLTATCEVGDSPTHDEDPDADDLLIRLYINGEPVRSRQIDQGSTIQHDIWFTDFDASRLVTHLPLIIGSSTPTSEYTSGVLDEFLLFAEALTAGEVAALFAEVSGPDGVESARQEGLRIAEAEGQRSPQLTTLSQYGLTAGSTTRLSIRGHHLTGNPRANISGLEVTQRVLPESTPEDLQLEILVPPSTAAGVYPLRVCTDSGLSSALPLAVDRLPEHQVTGTSPDMPAELPAAFSGTLSGSDRPRIYFRGRAGQRVVADLEVRRLGSSFEPVLELCDPRGVPLKIEWRKVPLQGDARAELSLPAEGVYFVEVHDLRYKARERSPFRVKIGDLTLIDALYPPVAAEGTVVQAEPIGTGITASRVPVDCQPRPASARDGRLLSATAHPRLPDIWRVAGSVPSVRLSSASEFAEGVSAPEALATIDARFAANRRPVAISGRILVPGERDVYTLMTTPGDKLKLTLQARALDSPLDGQLLVMQTDRKQLAANPPKVAVADPRVEVTVPEGTDRLLVEISDLPQRGGPQFVYRLEIAPSSRPDFQVTLLTKDVNLPRGGSALIELDVERAGYRGPIKLRVAGNDQISIQPEQIAAEGRIVATLVHTGELPADVIAVQVLAESHGHVPVIRRAAMLRRGMAGSLAMHRESLPIAVTPSVGPAIDVAELPVALVMGLNAELPLAVRQNPAAPTSGALRFSLVSNERPRPANIFLPEQGNKPLVRAAADQTAGLDQATQRLTVLVPTEVEQTEIEFVVKGEVVPHPFSEVVLGTTFSRPFRLKVDSAVDVQFEPSSLELVSEQKTKLRGKILRKHGFTGPVELALNPLPIVYEFEPVKVAADQDQFELPVTPARFAEEVRLPFSRIIVTATDGGAQLVNRPLPLRLLPAKTN